MAIRQWQLMEALQGRRRGLTVRQLIEQTGASRATVYRDLDVLMHAGVPLVRERIAGEVRHRLMNAHCTRVGLEPHEVAALTLARAMLEPLEGMRAVDTLDALLRRIATGASGVPPVSRTGPAAGEHRGTLRAIDLAIRNGQRLEFEYRSARSSEHTRRCVDPVSIRVHRDQPYLVAFDLDRSDWRVFKLARIDGDIELAGTADPHPEYDEALLFAHSAGVWSGEGAPVAVRLAASVADRALEYRLHEAQTIEREADGSVVVRATVAGLVEALRWVLAWGAAAQVIEPDDLRDAVRQELEGALAGYADRPVSDR